METFFKKLITNSPNKMITYAEYISHALYHPEHGYYMKDQMKIGREGDFITTSNVSNIYGKVIARWYAENYTKLNLPPAICEIGGGNGRFAQAFIEGWNLYSSRPIEYTIIDSSPYHRKLQKEKLKDFPGFTQYQDISELADYQGLVFSNELFDALPVHVIQMRNGEVCEVMVTFNHQGLQETFIPLESRAIKAFITEYGINLNEGQRIEIPLEMEKMIQTLGRSVRSGLTITVDYGYEREEWNEPSRMAGSLRGYYRQQMYQNILQHPGMMDITSHVHFDALIEQGEKYGLRLISKLRQDEFLLKIGILEELKENYDPNPFSEKSNQNRAIRSLVTPGWISSAFHVIVQAKEVETGVLEIKKAMG